MQNLHKVQFYKNNPNFEKLKIFQYSKFPKKSKLTKIVIKNLNYLFSCPIAIKIFTWVGFVMYNLNKTQFFKISKFTKKNLNFSQNSFSFLKNSKFSRNSFFSKKN